MNARAKFIEDYQFQSLNLSELCRRHNISRTTAYKWIGRFNQEGEQGLKDRIRRPKNSPRKTSDKIEKEVIKLRAKHPCWGGRKIQRVLINEGMRPDLAPAPSTITNVLRRHDMLSAGTREGATTFKRFERAYPNELWQMDFKGHIGMDGGARCHPLTVLDDHSRFNLVLKACAKEDRITVQAALTEAFERYGLPKAILCDHGSPWGMTYDSVRRTRLVPGLTVWLTRLGIKLFHGRVAHPQTQGKEERFHRTLKAEVLMRESLWLDLKHCQREFDAWQKVYNHKRPHEALGMDTPSSHYQPSQRRYPSILPEEESFYLSEDTLRRVQSRGEINFKNGSFYIGEGFKGELIALRPVGENQWDVFYCWRRLGAIDLNQNIKPKNYYTKLLP